MKRLDSSWFILKIVVNWLTACLKPTNPDWKPRSVHWPGEAPRMLTWRIEVGGTGCGLSWEEHQRTCFLDKQSLSEAVGQSCHLVEEVCQMLSYIQMGLSLNEHIWWASPPRLLSEDVSGQQSTSVTQSAAIDCLAPKTSTPTLPHCAKCAVLLVVPAQCLRIINESVRERGHQDFSSACGSWEFSLGNLKWLSEGPMGTAII